MRIVPPRPRNDEERILPLINVVFLLLIFFMLAGELSAHDPFDIQPPTSSSTTPAESRDIVLQLAADGRMALDGEEIAEADLVPAIRGISDHLASADLFLKSDASIEAVHVVEIMEKLRGAGVTKLRLLTVENTQ